MSTSFKISSFCAGGGCVALAPTPDAGALVRDTKHGRDDRDLLLTSAALRGLLRAARSR